MKLSIRILRAKIKDLKYWAKHEEIWSKTYKNKQQAKAAKNRKNRCEGKIANLEYDIKTLQQGIK